MKGMNGMVFKHYGGPTGVSFDVLVSRDGRKIQISFPDGSSSFITMGKSVISLVNPSEDGNTMLCLPKKGDVALFDTVSGKELTLGEIKKRNPKFCC